MNTHAATSLRNATGFEVTDSAIAIVDWRNGWCRLSFWNFPPLAIKHTCPPLPIPHLIFNLKQPCRTWRQSEPQPNVVMEMSFLYLSQRGRRKGSRGGSCPPTFERWGVNPSSFSHLFVLWLLYGCMVTIFSDYLHLIYIIVFVNTYALVTPEKSGMA